MPCTANTLSSEFDAVVIGAGLGGLAAAAQLAKAGKSVLVLERQNVAGGYAQGFRRGEFLFDVGLHAIDGAASGGWTNRVLQKLGILSRLEMHTIDPLYVVRASNRQIVAHSDINAFREELARHFPKQRSGVQALFESAARIYSRVVSAIECRDRHWNEVNARSALGSEVEAVLKQSLLSFLSYYIDDIDLINVLGALWTYFGLPPSKLSAAAFLVPWVSYHQYGASYPRGGAGAVSGALYQIIESNGGKLLFGQTVERIEVENERVVAVQTASGLAFAGRTVIANTNVPDAFLRLIDRKALPSDFIRKVQQMKPSLSNINVYLGLNKDLSRTGWPWHEVLVTETNDPDSDYDSIQRGEWNRMPLAITCYHPQSGAAPDGASVLSVFSLATPDCHNHWGTTGVLQDYSINKSYRTVITESFS